MGGGGGEKRGARGSKMGRQVATEHIRGLNDANVVFSGYNNRH